MSNCTPMRLAPLAMQVMARHRIYKRTDNVVIRVTAHKGTIPIKLQKYGVKTIHAVQLAYKDWRPHLIMNEACAGRFLKTKSGKVTFNPYGTYKGYILLDSEAHAIEKGIIKCMKIFTPKVCLPSRRPQLCMSASTIALANKQITDCLQLWGAQVVAQFKHKKHALSFRDAKLSELIDKVCSCPSQATIGMTPAKCTASDRQTEPTCVCANPT